MKKADMENTSQHGQKVMNNEYRTTSKRRNNTISLIQKMKRTKQQLGVMIGYRKAEINKLKEQSERALKQAMLKKKELTILEKEYEENDF